MPFSQQAIFRIETQLISQSRQVTVCLPFTASAYGKDDTYEAADSTERQKPLRVLRFPSHGEPTHEGLSSLK